MVQFPSISLFAVCIFGNLVTSVKEAREKEEAPYALTALLLACASALAIAFDILSSQVVGEPCVFGNGFWSSLLGFENLDNVECHVCCPTNLSFKVRRVLVESWRVQHLGAHGMTYRSATSHVQYQ